MCVQDLLAGSSPCMFPMYLAFGLASVAPGLLDSSRAHISRLRLLLPIENIRVMCPHRSTYPRMYASCADSLALFACLSINCHAVVA